MAAIRAVEPPGAEIHLHVETGGHSLIACVPPNRGFKVGETSVFEPNPEKMRFFDAGTGKAIFS
ncbi:MAG: hypothetical protein FWG35_01295 [Spirochaetaceae bacterium]|nr:hypothetical protein [Spirochaetaceae bacterium]